MCNTNRNAVKKRGRRLAGTWGRINHKWDMRRESKGTRAEAKRDLRNKLAL